MAIKKAKATIKKVAGKWKASKAQQDKLKQYSKVEEWW